MTYFRPCQKVEASKVGKMSSGYLYNPLPFNQKFFSLILNRYRGLFVCLFVCLTNKMANFYHNI